MYIRLVTGFLALLVFCAPAASVGFASDTSSKALTKKEKKIRKHSAKIRKGLDKLGTGMDSVVEVKLRNKTKIKGYVSEINESDFTVVDEAGSSHVVQYDDTKKVRGNNLSKGAWIAIGFGIGAVIFGILLYAVVTSGR